MCGSSHLILHVCQTHILSLCQLEHVDQVQYRFTYLHLTSLRHPPRVSTTAKSSLRKARWRMSSMSACQGKMSFMVVEGGLVGARPVTKQVPQKHAQEQEQAQAQAQAQEQKPQPQEPVDVPVPQIREQIGVSVTMRRTSPDRSSCTEHNEDAADSVRRQRWIFRVSDRGERPQRNRYNSGTRLFTCVLLGRDRFRAEMPVVMQRREGSENSGNAASAVH